MKKIISLVLTLVMLLACATAFASCESADDKLYSAYNNCIKPYKFDSTGLPDLVVATSPDFSPMEFIDSSKTGNDKYVGFDIILAKYLAKELNMNLVIKPMAFDACTAALEVKSADLAISGFSWTADRAENFLITDWYIAGENETEQIIITTKANEGKLTTKESFAGMKIGAQGGSLQQILVTESFGAENMQLYQNLDDAVEALKTGKIDALAVAAGNGDAFIAKNPDSVATSGFNFVVEDKYKNNVILLNKESTELYTKVNAALAKALEAGVYDTWYEACQILSEIKTIDELGYDADGNKITE